MADDRIREVQRLVAALAKVGTTIGGAMAGVADEEMTGNAPVLVLFSLDLDGPQRPTALQEITGLSSGGLTRLVERLETAGLVTRRSGALAEDRRAVLVALTPRGRRTARAMAAAGAASIEEHRDLMTDLAGYLDP